MQLYIKNVAGESRHTTTTPPALGCILTVMAATPLTIRSDTTIGDLKTLIPLSSSSVVDDSIDPQSVRLIHAGRHLSSPSATLSSLSIPQGSTLHIALPLLGGNDDAKDAQSSGPAAPAATPSKPKAPTSRKPRCGFKACKEKVQPIVGDCGFCKKCFCAKHRMLESHSCEGLEDCKDEARERNREQLERERTRPLQAL